MLRNLSKKRGSAVYSPGPSVGSTSQEGKVRETPQPHALEVDTDGAVVLRQNPADSMNRTQEQPVGRTLRQQRTFHRENMLTSRRTSGIPAADSIGAAHGPDVNSKTLQTFGTLKNNKAVYSPLQGTQSLAAHQITSIVPVASAGEALPMAIHNIPKLGDAESKHVQASTIISEMENLAIDTHQQWLEAFVFAPIPALIVSCTISADGDVIHQVLQANSSAVMVLGRDAASLKMQNLEDLITYSATGNTSIFGQGTGTGLVFKVDGCSIQTVHRPIQAGLILIPISDVCTVGRPSCFLVLILDEKHAVPAASSVLSSIPTVAEAFQGVECSKARKGMFCCAVASHIASKTSEAEHEGYCQADSLNVAYSEAAQRLLDGKCPQCIMPSPFDVASWITKFNTLLTVTADK